MSLFKKYTTQAYIRWNDLDAFGHVNNAVYFTYFEDGRQAFFIEVLGMRDIKQFQFIMAHQSCDYFKPIRLASLVDINLWVGEIGEKRFTLKYELVDQQDNDVIYASGETLIVTYDYQKQQTIKIPDDILEKMKDYHGQQT